MTAVSTTYSNPAELLDSVGQDLGATEWMTIDQDRINMFADATDDHQWIHVDAERAAAGPFGATIAHGFLTLSLTSVVMEQLLVVQNIAMGINYGLNKVRFPSPVVVGSRIRGTATLTSAEEIGGGAGVQAVVTVTMQIEGQDKPACVAECVVRYLS